MRPPKIAVMSSGLGHVARGVETWADSVATELDRRGLDVTLFKGAGRNDRDFERVVPCVRRRTRLADWAVRLAPAFAWRFGCHQTYDFEQTTFALAVLPHLVRARYDLIHLQDPWLGLILEKTKSLHGASIILGHGTEEAPWLLRKFQHVQELSPFYLGRHGDLGERQWFAVPNFIDTTKFAPGDRLAARRTLGLPESGMIVLSVSSLNRSTKRLDWLAREFAAANRADACLVLAGALEAESASLVSEVESLLGDRVRILKNVPHQQMPLLYQAADVHVMCSLKEVLGISILEAMSASLPNIAHQWGSVKWVVGDAGWNIDMQRTGELTAALQKLDEPTCRHYGALARERARQTFSIEAVVDQMQAMYDTVLTRRSASRQRIAPTQSAVST